MNANNWMVQVKMYVEVMDNNTYYRYYFVFFYYFTVIVSLNIVVAFAIDMYTSIERLDKDRDETLQTLKLEMNDGVKNTYIRTFSTAGYYNSVLSNKDASIRGYKPVPHSENVY